MTTLREQLSAWIVVAVLAVVAWSSWDLGPQEATRTQDTTLACEHPGDRGAVMVLPRRAGWAPDPVLAGLPEEGGATTGYEISEAHNLARYRGALPDAPLVASRSSSAARDAGTC